MTPAQIRALRKSNGWTQKDLAEACGVSKRTVENWEQGRTGISGPARKILDGLGKITLHVDMRAGEKTIMWIS